MPSSGGFDWLSAVEGGGDGIGRPSPILMGRDHHIHAAGPIDADASPPLPPDILCGQQLEEENAETGTPLGRWASDAGAGSGTAYRPPRPRMLEIAHKLHHNLQTDTLRILTAGACSQSRAPVMTASAVVTLRLKSTSKIPGHASQRFVILNLCGAAISAWHQSAKCTVTRFVPRADVGVYLRRPTPGRPKIPTSFRRLVPAPCCLAYITPRSLCTDNVSDLECYGASNARTQQLRRRWHDDVCLGLGDGDRDVSRVSAVGIRMVRCHPRRGSSPRAEQQHHDS